MTDNEGVVVSSEKYKGKALKLNAMEVCSDGFSNTCPGTKNNARNAIFVTNLHRGATAFDLCLIFQDCGRIENAFVPNQKKIVRNREAGVVVFTNPDSVEKALQKSQKNKIRGVRIVVHQEDPFAALERKSLKQTKHKKFYSKK